MLDSKKLSPKKLGTYILDLKKLGFQAPSLLNQFWLRNNFIIDRNIIKLKEKRGTEMRRGKPQSGHKLASQ